MQKYRKRLGLFQFNPEKTEVVEAMPWQKQGDHLAVVPSAAQERRSKSQEPFDVMCRHCYRDVADHGLLVTPLVKFKWEFLTTSITELLKLQESKDFICPGDYLVKVPGRPIHLERQAADKFAERYQPA
jgi:hypothetical protein